MKKIISAFIAAILIVLPLSIAASAAPSFGYGIQSSRCELLDGSGNTMDNTEVFRIISSSLKKRESRIDLNSFNIPATKWNYDSLYNLVDEIPDAVTEKVTLYAFPGYISHFDVSYPENASDMEKQLRQVRDSMTKDIKYNNNLTDAEKALLLHDRLIVNCEYDSAVFLGNEDNPMSYTAYGALVLGKAVCQGYSAAYKYLLDDVGIKNTYTSSEILNHIWNIVEINGNPYHVDVTWDDPLTNDAYYGGGENGYPRGKVCHNNFLLSSKALYNGVNGRGHEADDYDFRPSSGTYDFVEVWQNSEAEFILVDNEIYYIDSVNGKIGSYYDGREIYSFGCHWAAGPSSFWAGTYSSLAAEGNRLFFNDNEKILSYNLARGELNTVYKPDLSYGKNISVYGFTLRDGVLYCDTGNKPDNAEIRTFTFRINDMTPPQISFMLSEDGKFSFTLWDENGAAGYYFGKNPDFGKNTFFKGDTAGGKIDIPGEGTYYFTAEDKYGNVSDTEKITVILKDGAYKEVKKGDVNGDGEVSSNDARIVLRVAVKLENISSELFIIADADGNGTISSNDARKILRAAVKLENI